MLPLPLLYVVDGEVLSTAVVIALPDETLLVEDLPVEVEAARAWDPNAAAAMGPHPTCSTAHWCTVMVPVGLLRNRLPTGRLGAVAVVAEVVAVTMRRLAHSLVNTAASHPPRVWMATLVDGAVAEAEVAVAQTEEEEAMDGGELLPRLGAKAVYFSC